MNCPSCGAEHPRGAAECPSCGIIFEKWRAKQARESAPAPSSSSSPSAPAAAGGGFFSGLLIYIVLPVGLLAGAVYGIHWKKTQERAAAKAAAEATERAKQEAYRNTPQTNLQLQVKGDDICFAGWVRNLSTTTYSSVQLQVRFHGAKRGLEDPPPIEVGPLPAGQDKRLDDPVVAATPELLEALGGYKINTQRTHYTIDVVAFTREP